MMSTVVVDGARIGYDLAGSGPAIAFLHGFTRDARVWRRQVEGLSDTFTVVAWDAPGAGRSDDPPETFSLREVADRLAGLLGAIGIDTAVLVGLSWGGMVAQEAYRRYPDRIDGLVLADTYAGWAGSLPAATVRDGLGACLADADLPAGEFMPRYLPGMLGPSASAAARAELVAITAELHPAGFRMMSRTSAATDARDLLPRIDVRTLLIWGDADARSPLSVASQFLTAIPKAELELVEGAGHVSNIEQPERFNGLVRDFCASLP